MASESCLVCGEPLTHLPETRRLGPEFQCTNLDCPACACPECGAVGWEECHPECQIAKRHVAWYSQFPLRDMDGSHFEAPDIPDDFLPELHPDRFISPHHYHAHHGGDCHV